MQQLPQRNLPDKALPWARALEAEVELAQRAQVASDQQLQAALSIIQSQSSQLTTLQNYIRTICDLQGINYPPAPSVPVPPPTPNPTPTPVNDYLEIPAQWSATWYQGFKRTSAGGTNDDRNSLYQRGSGYTFSMWRFDVGRAAGKQITKGEMYLSNISTYYNGPFTAFLGTHGSAGEPGSRPGGDRQNGFNVGWTAGEGKWISLPQWALDGLSNGSIQGFTMGDTGRDTQNYARFNGVGRAGAPVLRLNFNV